MSSLSNSFENLLINSISKQTWAKHSSAWNLYKEFCFCFNTKFELPILVQYVRAFSTWAVTARGLKSSTVKSYISSLNTAHVLSSVEGKNLNLDTCVKMILKGAENSFSLEHTC